MLGLFCKGLHCAGCGKGIPFSVVLLLVGIVAVHDKNFDAAIGGAIVEATIIGCATIAAAWIIGIILLSLFIRKGPPVAYVKKETDWVSFSQRKFLETGDTKWLELHGPIVIGEVSRVEDRSYSVEVVQPMDSD